MRILVYSDRFGGNTTTFIYNEVIGLTKKNDVKYLCIERQNEQKFPFSNVEVCPYNPNKLVKKIRWWMETSDRGLYFHEPAFSKKINSVVDEFKPDIVHCHFGYEALRFYDNLDEKNRRLPFVVSFRGYDASEHLRRNSYVKKIGSLLSQSNVYSTFVCDFLRNNLVAKNIHPKKYIILHSGTKIDQFIPSGNASKFERFTFFQVSSFEKKKGHLITIRAFSKLLSMIKSGADRPQLILAGDGSVLNDAKQLVKELGIEESVQFPGWINHSDAKEFMLKSHCFVHHSITVDGNTEGIPNSLMEAMAMELPVISTWHAGIPELVENNVNGFLVTENDIDEYSRCMLKMLSWKPPVSNRKKIEDEFEFSKHMSKLENFYESIVSSQTNNQIR